MRGAFLLLKNHNYLENIKVFSVRKITNTFPENLA